MYADAVIEGGGVKGIGLVGAIYEAEERGYQWKRLAGTSAGAIIASLLAAGYTAKELREEMLKIDYHRFIEKKGLQHVPLLGDLYQLWRKCGIYNGNYIEEWSREKLLAKGVKTFEDLSHRLYIIASDITSGEMLVFPNDLKRYGIDPNQFEIAKAIRMSASLPYFFQPAKLKEHYIVDGGILSNFPVWLFDENQRPKWPTFGFRLVSEKTGKPNRIDGPISMGFSIVSTMIEAHDTRHIKEQDYVRTILVPTLGIQTTDFDLTEQQSEALFQSGVQAAKKFFKQWDFDRYVVKYILKSV